MPLTIRKFFALNSSPQLHHLPQL